jgi:hypothetical protein
MQKATSVLLTAGSSWLASGLMLKEQARAKQALQERTLAPENLTVSVDGWTDQAKHSVYACTLSFPDGTTALFDAVDLSEETHSGKNLAGQFTLFYCFMPCACLNAEGGGEEYT